jgi:hypothetical protein
VQFLCSRRKKLDLRESADNASGLERLALIAYQGFVSLASLGSIHGIGAAREELR